MQLIAAVDNNWAIGFQNSLLVRIPRDQQMFREMTEGKVIVVGRKTFETFPQKQPLKNRVNIILSRDQKYKVKGAEVVHSMDELLEALKNYDSRDVFVAGGAGVYEQLLPYCDTAHITKIDYTYQRTRTARGWTQWQTGTAQQRVRSRPILTSSIIFRNMREKNSRKC